MDEKDIRTAPRAGGKELWAALAMYPVAYIYTLIAGPRGDLWFGVFTLMFVALAEYLLWDKPRSGESWVWLGCLLVISACVSFGWGRVWEAGMSILFGHALAVWWVLVRSGALLQGETGTLLPLDVFDGLIRLPFGNFFLRLRCLWTGTRRDAEREGERRRTLPAILAAALALLLLYWAADSLASADKGFGRMVSGILSFLAPKDTEALVTALLRLLFSLPVGAWLYGLLVGGRRSDRAELDARAGEARKVLARLRAVPEGLWLVCMGLFALVYLLFFIVQGRYLFGAFTRTLPEGFIVSEYARQGFFELCRVMGINFLLLWLVTRTGRDGPAGGRGKRLMCTLLLAAGLFFAVVALSKLGLYISCFGFTPRRLQSTWLAALLLTASLCALYSLWTGKKSFRFLTLFAAVTLTLLHLY